MYIYIYIWMLSTNRRHVLEPTTFCPLFKRNSTWKSYDCCHSALLEAVFGFRPWNGSWQHFSCGPKQLVCPTTCFNRWIVTCICLKMGYDPVISSYGCFNRENDGLPVILGGTLIFMGQTKPTGYVQRCHGWLPCGMPLWQYIKTIQTSNHQGRHQRVPNSVGKRMMTNHNKPSSRSP